MIRGGTRVGACALVAFVVGPVVAADPAPTCVWKLGVSDLARYDRRRITVKDGAE